MYPNDLTTCYPTGLTYMVLNWMISGALVPRHFTTIMRHLHFLAPCLLAGFANAQTAFLIDTTLDDLFLVDCTTGVATFLADVDNNGLTTAADLSYRFATGELWTVDLSGGEIGTINPASGTFTPMYQTNLSGWQGIAWDETTQLFFLANQNDNNYSFDPATSQLTLLGNSGTGLLTCLDTDLAGNLYGIDFSSGDVMLIDKVTGVGTLQSTTTNGMQGLGIDPVTGIWFGSSSNTDSLYTIDPITGVSVLIGAHGAGVTFMKGFDLIDFGFGTFATNTTFGTACSTLRISGDTRPVIGSSWDLIIGSVPANAVLGLLLLDLTNPILALAPLGAPGCTLYSGGTGLVVLPLPVAFPAFSFAIPGNPALVGQSVFAQGAVIEPGVNALEIVTSNGLMGCIGDF